jgi:hypothetical protein
MNETGIARRPPPTRHTIRLWQTCYVQGLFITDGADIEAKDVPGERPVALHLRPTTLEEQKLGHTSVSVVEVYWTHEAPLKGYAALVEYAEGKFCMPQPDGGRLVPPFDELPGPLKELWLSASRGVGEVVARCLAAVRWRVPFPNFHAPYIATSVDPFTKWSDDGETWREGPIGPSQVIALGGGSAPRLSRHPAEIAEVAAGLREPVYHDLFREAWPMRLSNTRGALVVGLAAAETGIKTILVSMAPAAEWIILNSPSPPFLRMLREGLPKALEVNQRPLRFNLAGRGGALKTLEDGVEMRNRCVHHPGFVPGFEKVEEVLNAVRDVLYMYDVYAGFEWAIGRIRARTLAEWTLA